MSRLVEKVNLPVYGEMYVACAEDASMESMQALQEPLKKLYEYEQEEERGVLLRMPCIGWMDIAFGDQQTFFGIDKTYTENSIREITVDNSERITWYDGWETLAIKGSDENGFDWEFRPEEIGNTVFLTREDAEKKLKEMEAEAGD